MFPFRWGMLAFAVVAFGSAQAQETSGTRPLVRLANDLPQASVFDDTALYLSGGLGDSDAGAINPSSVLRKKSLSSVSSGEPTELALTDFGSGVTSTIESRPVESSWYTRQEYFHWREEFGGADFVNEDGLLLTLGYQRRLGPERYRAEVFGGTMHYDGGAQFEDGSTEPLRSKTGYLGARAEYDFLFEPAWLPRSSLLIGLGTRFWFRDLRDGLTESGVPVLGYQETWWTIYPYLGVETRRGGGGRPELFLSSRIGCTAITYEHATFFDAVLYPKTGLTGQLEVGIRGHHFFCSAISEVFAWRQSSVARGALQPESTLFTVGLKAGVNF